MGAFLPLLLELFKKGNRKNAVIALIVVSLVCAGIWIERASAWQKEVEDKMEKYDALFFVILDMRRDQKEIKAKLGIRDKRRQFDATREAIIREFEVQELIEHSNKLKEGEGKHE